MQLSCSVRLVYPFMKFASSNDARRALVPSTFWAAGTDSRVSLESAQLMLESGVEYTKDDNLGLKIGSSMRFGGGGTFDYVVRSAPDIVHAVAAASKYSRLLSDDFHVSFERFSGRALVKIEGVWSRSTADFAMGSLFSVHLGDLTAANLECWFPHAAPRELIDYERIFPGASFRFDAPFCGFSFAEEASTLPLPGSDPDVHQVLVARADRMLEEILAHKPVSASVERFASRELSTGGTSPDVVANALRMSPRTLSRRLAKEGTTFNALLDDVRKQRSLELLRDPKVPLTEVAFLLGFSHVESFYRAFKRWTGTTPLIHRNKLLSA
jgi:AraC-like DNA-binding protein